MLYTRTRWHAPTRVVLSLALLAVMAVTGCGQVSHAPVTRNAADQWASLERRPLHLPVVKAGMPCPLAPARQVTPKYGIGLGDGPVYPVGLGYTSTLAYAVADAFGDGSSAWGGQKVLWIVSPAYQGPVLVRGSRLDGSGVLRFNGGLVQSTYNGNWTTAPLLTELRLAGNGSGSDTGEFSTWVSYTRLQVPGCYVYQVDGHDFSEIIVFEAVPER